MTFLAPERLIFRSCAQGPGGAPTSLALSPFIEHLLCARQSSLNPTVALLAGGSAGPTLQRGNMHKVHHLPGRGAGSGRAPQAV